MQLTKSLFASKGPLNKAELEKQKALSPLYVAGAKQAIKSFAPPPKRAGIEPGGAATTEGTRTSTPIAHSAPGASVRTVQAVYDYEGSSIDELPIAEGEHLTVIETGEFPFLVGFLPSLGPKDFPPIGMNLAALTRRLIYPPGGLFRAVSSDWLKCRNSVGSEGLVPTSYVR